MGFYFSSKSLPAQGKIIQFPQRLVTEFWSQAGIGGNFHQRLSTLVAGRSELLLLRKIARNNFSEYQIASFMQYTPIHTCFKWTFFLLVVNATMLSIYGSYFPFWGPVATFNTILFFNRLFRVNSPDNLSPYQRILLHLSDFLRHAVWRC